MTEEEYDAKLVEVLEEHNATHCAHCGHKIGWGDVAWNNASTEVGTGYCIVEIECVSCYREVVHIRSWWPSIDDKSDVLKVLEIDWN